jgi:hypothetical protein
LRFLATWIMTRIGERSDDLMIPITFDTPIRDIY